MTFTENLLGYWKFDDVASSSFYTDYFGIHNFEMRYASGLVKSPFEPSSWDSGRSIVGIIHNNIPIAQEVGKNGGYAGYMGQAFSGSTATQMSYAVNKDPDMYISGTFTFAAWIKYDNYLVAPQIIFTQKQNETSSYDILIRIDGEQIGTASFCSGLTGSKFVLSMSSSTAGETSITSSAFHTSTRTLDASNQFDNTPDNPWNLLIASYDADNHIMQIDIGTPTGGLQLNNASTFITAAFQPRGETTLFLKKSGLITNRPVSVPCIPGMTAFGDFINGLIDDMYLWTRLLTDEEKHFLYTANPNVIYKIIEDQLEVNRVYENSSKSILNDNKFKLDINGNLFLSGSVIEDPTMTEEFHLTLDGNLRVRKLVEKFYI